jgi:RsiW-degrading membrane proteinase PrsW (M82 family)
MVPSAPPQLSQDSNWWWNGEHWVAAKSPDHLWQWDGHVWIPIPQKQVEPLALVIPLRVRRHRFLWVFFVGLAGFVTLTWAIITAPSVPLLVGFIALGAFFVPVAYTTYLNDSDALGGLPLSMFFKISLATALFALPSAYVLERLAHVSTSSLPLLLLVGFIEEGVKLLVVLFFVRRSKYRYELNGVIIGATVGMAFAGFENVGYATAYFLQGGTTALLVTLWLRSLLGPFGHGTWTASIAAVVWRERFSGRGRLDAKVLWAYLVSSLLHGLWDIAPMLGLLALPWMLLVGLASILILRHRLREAHAQQHSGLALAPGPLP